VIGIFFTCSGSQANNKPHGIGFPCSFSSLYSFSNDKTKEKREYVGTKMSSCRG
jgi:hypothetical protein